MRHPLANSVRMWRERLQLSQTQLAFQIRTSRQTLNAIEASRTVPSAALALRLAAALGCRVEELFHLPSATHEVTARLAGHVSSGSAPVRVRLSKVGEQAVAIPLAGRLATVASLAGADGVVHPGSHGKTVRVQLLTSAKRLAETVVVAGCDPALPVVAAHLQRLYPHCSLAWLPAGSLQALHWLQEGAAHVAGLHLRDRRTGQENVPVVQRILGRTEVLVLGFAMWEEGLIVKPGNPKGIHGVGDLARYKVAIINRERGSGARALLDAELLKSGIAPKQVRGYAREATSHLAVAGAVALGLVDAGIGIRAAARAYGLTFLPLQHERYDLVVPKALLNHPTVQALLETAQRPVLRQELEAIGDYDTSRLGVTLAVLP